MNKFVTYWSAANGWIWSWILMSLICSMLPYPIWVVGICYIVITVVNIAGIIKTCEIREIWFCKLKEKAVIPSKRSEDGCYDVYACIDEDIVIKPGETKLVPTGIASAFAKSYRVSVRERGSNTKWGGRIAAGQIDSGYRGEYFIAVQNPTKKKIVISDKYTEIKEIEKEYHMPTTKAIAQIAIEKVPFVVIKEVSPDKINNTASERGVGKLGSSNK